VELGGWGGTGGGWGSCEGPQEPLKLTVSIHSPTILPLEMRPNTPRHSGLSIADRYTSDFHHQVAPQDSPLGCQC
jgi:hypothetical protein